MKNLPSIVTVLVLLIELSVPIFGAEILYISMTPSPSHHIWDKTLAMALRERHHKITYITHFTEKNIENFTVITFEDVYEKNMNAFDFELMSLDSSFEGARMMFQWMYYTCQMGFETQGYQQVKALIAKKPKFDLIVFDLTLGHCLYPLIELFDTPPIVGTSQFGLIPYFYYHFGIDLHSSYIPSYALTYTDKMSFFERMHNYIFNLMFLFWRQYIYMPAVWEMTQKEFGKDIRSYQEVEKNMSLLLVNYDAILDYPQPIPPAIIPVGGLHTKRQTALPKDLQKILDESKNGVILFTLGSNLKSSKLSKGRRNALVDAFAQMKQTIIWKYEEDDIENLPKNVIIRSWLPQNSILAHPNVKLLLTHGGGLSTQEAMYHGVPVVAIPFFVDQHVNAHKMEMRKLGKKLDFPTMTKEIIYDTITEVIKNPEYKINAMRISNWYRDQPTDPLSKAVWWVEYALRNGGAEQLSIAAKNMPMYQVNFLDIWGFIIVVIISVIVIIRIIAKIICKRFCNKSDASHIKKKIN